MTGRARMPLCAGTVRHAEARDRSGSDLDIVRSGAFNIRGQSIRSHYGGGANSSIHREPSAASRSRGRVVGGSGGHACPSTTFGKLRAPAIPRLFAPLSSPHKLSHAQQRVRQRPHRSDGPSQSPGLGKRNRTHWACRPRIGDRCPPGDLLSQTASRRTPLRRSPCGSSAALLSPPPPTRGRTAFHEGFSSPVALS